MPRLFVYWSTQDPKLAGILSGIAERPEGSIERLAAEAALHTFMAQECHEQIGRFQMERRMWARNRRRSVPAKDADDV